MPKLPDYTALPQGQPNPSGRIAHYSPAGFSAGQEAYGAAFKEVGSELTKIGTKWKEEDDQLQQAQADADFRVGLNKSYVELSRDPDYQTAPQRFSEQSRQQLEQSAGIIHDPQKRELFKARHTASISTYESHLDNISYKRWGDETVANWDITKGGLIDAAASAPTPEEQAKHLRAIQDGEAALVQSRLINATQANARTRAAVQLYADNWGKSLPPEERKARADQALEVLRTQQQPQTPGQQSLKGEAPGVDPRLVGIMREASRYLPEGYTASIESGRSPRAAGTPWHPAGQALDIQVYDPQGKKVPWYQNAQSFPIYEQFAHAAKKVQSEQYPELNDKFRWGGYFSGPVGKYGAMDLMHFDVGGSGPGGGTKAGSFETGLSPEWAKQWGVTGSVPMGGRQLTAQQAPAERTELAQAGGDVTLPGQPTRTPFDFLPQSKLMQIRQQADREILHNRAEASKSREEQFDRVIIDAKADIGELPPRAAIEQDPSLTEGHRNVLLRKYDSAAEDVNKAKVAMRWFSTPGAPALNPYDKEQRDIAEQVYQKLGANDAALQAVIDKGQVLPQSVGVGLRGALVSSDPIKVQGALTTASNLQARVPNVFTHVEGAKDITDAVVAYRHDVEDLGFTAAEAAARYTESKTPEYQTKLKARIKSEDLNEIVKKQVSVSDVQSAFKQSAIPFFGKPTVGLDPESRRAMLGDFEEVFREKYLENGNVDLSKKLAADQLKKTWGVTKLNGSDVVMKFPPEMAPAYRNVENAAGLIAEQAIKDIKGETGQSVERGQLRFLPVPGGQTSTAYWNGEPPPYTVGWQDKNGVVHFAPRPFVADLKAAVPAQSEQRGQDFQRARDVQQFAVPKPPGQRRTGRPTLENFPAAPSSPQGTEGENFGSDMTLPDAVR